jgi:hypothetical protein
MATKLPTAKAKIHYSTDVSKWHEADVQFAKVDVGF